MVSDTDRSAPHLNPIIASYGAQTHRRCSIPDVTSARSTRSAKLRRRRRNSFTLLQLDADPPSEKRAAALAKIQGAHDALPPPHALPSTTLRCHANLMAPDLASTAAPPLAPPLFLRFGPSIPPALNNFRAALCHRLGAAEFYIYMALHLPASLDFIPIAPTRPAAPPSTTRPATPYTRSRWYQRQGAVSPLLDAGR